LPVRLTEDKIQQLFSEVKANLGYQLQIDLEQCRITLPGGEHFSFEVETSRRHSLINGLDDIGITLEDINLIEKYENNRRLTKPWLFDVIK